MIDAVFFSVAAVAFAGASLKARDLYTGLRRPGQLALCLLLSAMGLAFILLSDSAQEVESRVFPNLGRLLSNICTILANLCIVSHLLSMSYPPDRAKPMIRNRVIGYMIAIAIMVGTFLSSPVPARVGDFGGLYGEQPALVIYIGIYIVLFGKAMIDLLCISVRYARHARRRALRWGLGSVAVGSLIALVYIAEKAIFVQSQMFGLVLPFAGHDAPCLSVVWPAGCLFSVTFPLAAMLLIVVGMTLPTWGPTLTAPVRSYRDRRLYRRLGPLWRMLYEEFPHIVMPSTMHLGARWKLQRRVIEVRDGLIALSSYRTARLKELVNAAAERVGASEAERAALVEATLIVLSLEAYRRGDTAEPQEEGIGESGDAASLTGEASWLAAISEAIPSALKLQGLVHA